MEAKEKAIREAYVDLGIEWDLIKDHLTRNYWIRNPYEPVDLLWLIRDEKGIEVVIKGDNLGRLCFVPKSLSGIENNNGWSTGDLPTKECNYALGKFSKGAFRYIENQNLIQAKHALTALHYTHYREQHNYPSPIY